MQIMPFECAADYRFNPFDLTKARSHADYPPITSGGWCSTATPPTTSPRSTRPASRPPGWCRDRPEPGQDADGADLLLPQHASAPHRRQLRAAADQRAEGARALLQQGRRDDLPARRLAARLRANCYGGPRADPSKELPTWWVEAAEIGRSAYEKHADDDDFVQPRALYRDVMDDTDRERLVSNIVAHASDGVRDEIQQRVIAYWTKVDADLGARVAAGLGRATATRPGTRPVSSAERAD
jgi:catalase